MNKEKEKKPKRLEVRRSINEAGRIFFNNLYDTNKELANIAGEFMALNEEYVLNHYGEEETNGTVEILQVGFTANQLIFLERVVQRVNAKKEGEER